ncbi:hypothetical protein G9A89_021768 [Geosiphon pyriformis]|nr:hypothetical protein G9A89_021768 [Geosiphon pyriformis]
MLEILPHDKNKMVNTPIKPLIYHSSSSSSSSSSSLLLLLQETQKGYQSKKNQSPLNYPILSDFNNPLKSHKAKKLKRDTLLAVLERPKVNPSPQDFVLQLYGGPILEDLKKFAGYAKESYCLNDRLGKFGEGVYAHAFVNHEITDKTEIIIYLRGEEMSFENWRIWRPETIPYHGVLQARVNSKFYSTYLSVEGSLLSVLVNFINHKNYDKYSLRFTGHGIGAVYAVFAALSFLEIYPEIKDVNVITFGQPRIGNPQFAKHVDQLLPLMDRVTHSDDYVPQFFADQNFLHSAVETWISNDCNCQPAIDNFHICIPVSTGGRHEFDRENPYCNNSQRHALKIGSNAHNGPYFGHMMGHCS